MVTVWFGQKNYHTPLVRYEIIWYILACIPIDLRFP